MDVGKGFQVSQKFLRDNPNYIFVFGDNTIRRGKKGASVLRDEPNTYGFITKKFPSFDSEAYYKPGQYREVLKHEMEKLEKKIQASPDKIFMISELGGGLANKFNIRPMIVEATEKLKQYRNVVFI